MNDIYPQEHVLIINLNNDDFVVGILNNDKTKVKLIQSGEIFPEYLINGFIYQKYNVSPVWIQSAYVLVQEILNKIEAHRPPVNDFEYEDSVIEDSWSQKKLAKVIAERRADAEEKYEQIKNSYPTFSSQSTITTTEIYSLIAYCRNQAFGCETSHAKKYDILDF